MAFGNEVKDFIEAFQVGAVIKDKYKRRKLDEQEAKDRVTIAEMKEKGASERFGQVHDLNKQKLKQAADIETGRMSRKDRELGIREGSAKDTADFRKESNRLRKMGIDVQARTADSLNKYRTDTLGLNKQKHTDLQTRLKAEAAEKARKARIAANPASEFDPENQPGALPTEVTTTTGAPQNKGIPVESEPESKGTRAIPAGMAGPIGGAVNVATALGGGLKYLQDHFGLGGGLTGQGAAAQDGTRRLFEGEGTWDPEEKKAVESILDEDDIKAGVDPQKLTESMRNLRTLTKTYDK